VSPSTPKKPPGGPTRYRYIGYHATILESGQPLGPGDYVDMTADDLSKGINATLFEDGKLIDASDVSAGQQISPSEEVLSAETSTEEVPA